MKKFLGNDLLSRFSYVPLTIKGWPIRVVCLGHVVSVGLGHVVWGNDVEMKALPEIPDSLPKTKCVIEAGNARQLPSLFLNQEGADGGDRHRTHSNNNNYINNFK